MLKLKDKNKKLIAGLINYKDLCIESILATGDKKLSFSLHKKDKFYNFIEEECYIETKEAEFVIKARDVGVDYTRFDCVLNLEELEANIFDRFESVEQTITASLNLAIVGTGWTVKDNTLKKKRTVRCTNKNALEIVQEIKKTYRVDIVFNTLSKQIEVYEHLGEDKGTYFIDSLNLTALQVQSDSYKFATRIVAEGKDGLTFADINGGKNYVENYQYSKKVKTLYWKDERYTIKESLLEDARAKLKEISKPFVSYNASILNLAELNPKYKSILDYSLGDTITLISRNNKVKDKQRIVKILEYPQDHSRDTVELANAVLKFEDIQQENQETTDTVNNITTDNGTIDGSTIDGIKVKQIEDFKANVVEVVNLKAINANIDNLHANKADIQDLHAVTAKIGTLEATKANITQFNAVNAEISKLNSIKANIVDLNSATAKIGVLESKTASIDNLLAGNLTANNFKANSIVAGSAIIAENAIGSSQISSLTANKITTGTIDTSLVTVAGPNGRLKILGNRLQIFDDVNNRLFERIMLGINDKNRACLTLRATDGQTVLLTEEGLTKAGITDGFEKADDNSLSALKLDKNSIVRQVNGATETIAGTRIQVGDRTLDIELSTQKNTITEHSKELSSQKASLTALDNALKFKVDSQTFTQSTTTINNNINKAKEDAVNTANINTNESINAIEIGGRNLILDSNIPKLNSNWLSTGWNGSFKATEDERTYKLQAINGWRTARYNLGENLIGKQLTISFYGKLLSNESTSNINSLYLANGISGTFSTENLTSDIFEKDKWIKFTKTFILNSTGYIGFGCNCIPEGKNLKTTWLIKDLKIESGNKASAYTPAPEDLQSYANDVAKAKADLAQANAIANADGKITVEEKKRIQQAEANLNTAIARADKAKADAISEANRVSELKKNEAIKTAGLDAANKANNALNSAKAYTNAEITTVNTHLNKNTSEINILKGKIESKVSQSDINKSISEINFNNRNYVKDSNNMFLIGSDNPNNTKRENGKFTLLVDNLRSNAYCWWKGYENINSDSDICCSVDIKINDNTQGTLSLDCGNNSFHNGNAKGYDLKVFKKGEWKRISSTGKATSNFSGLLCLSIQGAKKGLVVEYRNFKVSTGLNMSDWTPAPEDMDQAITDNIKTVTDKISTVESKLTQENNSIKASVRDLNSTTQSITTNVSNINRDLTSKINSNLDAAKSFATDIAIAKANLAKEQAIASADGKITAEEQKRIQQAQANLNTAIARAEKAKQDAINAASTDATNKANNALNSAKAYTNAQVNTVNTKVSNVESNLNILKDKIESKVGQSDIDKSISSIKLGGRNLLKNTQDFKGWSLGRGTILDQTYNGCKVFYCKFNGSGCTDLQLTSCITPEPNKTYTLSFWAKGSSDMNSYFYPDSIKEGTNSQGKKTKASDGSINTKLSSSWERYWITWTTKDNVSGTKHILVSRLQGSSEKEVYVCGVKLEEGTKATDWTPAPEDTNQLIADNIKVVDTKISDVSSSITQLRDSVTTDIRAINSKTHSIETTLNGKASKQEVTEVNNRVATIKASLDGITQRVSATESKTQTLETTINGKASKQEVNNVSSKVVSLEANLSGITNRVSSTESRINTLNGQVANATTKQEFTEFKQSTNKFIMDIQQSGNENLCTNGGFESNDTNIVKSKSAQCGNAMVSGKVNEIIPQDGGNFFFIDTNGGDAYALTTLSFMFEEGQTYTISVDCRYASLGGKITGSSFVEYWGNYSRIWESQDFGYNWHRVSSTWTAPAGHGAGRAFIRFGIRCDKYAWGAFDNVKVEKGTMATGYTSPGNSICGNTITADKDKLRCQYEDGAYTQMGRNGFEWWKNGMAHPYHCLITQGVINHLSFNGGNYHHRVYLPPEFRGKHFKVQTMIQGWNFPSGSVSGTMASGYQDLDYTNGQFTIYFNGGGDWKTNCNIAYVVIA